MSAAIKPFRTLSGRGEAETRVRGSRFLAVAASVRSDAEARALVEERSRADWHASHHCSAWALRDGTRRANDAGEPSGSAGAPILTAIEGADLLDCMVVVTRWFGGTRLGVGGLIRAYGEAAAEALRRAVQVEAVPAVRLRIRYSYEHTSAVMRLLEQVSAQEVSHGFTPAGEGELRFMVPHSLEPQAQALLRELTAGALAAECRGESVLYRPVTGGA
jgi:uncharacterized YigZ family protein